MKFLEGLGCVIGNNRLEKSNRLLPITHPGDPDRNTDLEIFERNFTTTTTTTTQ